MIERSLERKLREDLKSEDTPTVVKAIRALRHEQILSMEEVSELIGHPDRKIRKEALKHIKLQTLSDWKLVTPKLMTPHGDPRSLDPATILKVLKQLPKFSEKGYSSDVFYLVYDTALRSDLDPRIVAEFIKLRPEITGTILTTLAQTKTSEDILRSIIEKEGPVEALDYQLRFIDTPNLSMLSLSNRYLTELMTTQKLSFESFYKLKSIIQPSLSLELKLAGQLSQNYLRMKRAGSISLETSKVHSFSRTRNKALEETQRAAFPSFFKSVFSKDEDWEEMLQFGITESQLRFLRWVLSQMVEIVSHNFREARRDSLGYTGKEETIPEIVLSRKGQHVFTRYATVDKEFRNMLIALLRRRPELLDADILHEFFHSMEAEQIFDFEKTDSSPGHYNHKSFTALLTLCCNAEDMRTCPAWESLYSGRYVVSKKIKFHLYEGYESVKEDRFHPFNVTSDSLWSVPDHEVESMIAYVESRGVKNVPNVWKESYILLKTFR